MRTPSERVKQGLPEEGFPRKKKNGQAKDLDVTVTEEKTNGDAPDMEITPEGDVASIKVDGDLQDIWERRVLNPEQKASEQIRIKRKGMKLRWINLASLGRYQRARYEEGWEPVPREQLVDEREVYGVSYTTENWICRGEKQNEMLVWMPVRVFNEIQAAKYRKVEESRRKIRESMLSQGAKHFNDKYGGSAGEEVVERVSAKPGTPGAFRGSINFGAEAVEPDASDLTPGGE